MYSLFLTLHSLVRWVVLVAGLLAAARALAGWTGRRPWTGLDDRLGLIFTVSLDVQFLVGLILYLFLSPFTTLAFQDFGASMRDADTRFWTVEHSALAVVALALAHLARMRVRRVDDPVRKHRIAAIRFVAAVVAIMLAIPWPGSSNARPLFRLGL